MLNSGKKFRPLRDNEEKYSNSCIVPFKLNGLFLNRGRTDNTMVKRKSTK